MRIPICKCNNCGTIYIDTNPQTGAVAFDPPLDTPTLTLQYDHEEGYFKGCPKCETDGYLMDITGNDDLTKEEQKIFKLA